MKKPEFKFPQLRARLVTLLLWLAFTSFVPNSQATDRARWAAEGQAAVESWLRSGPDESLKAEFGDFVSLEGSGFAEPAWNIQGYDYLTLNRTAHFTRGTIPMKIYVTEGGATTPGLTNVGTPVLEGPVSAIQGARIFVSHPELHLGFFKRSKTDIESAQNNKKRQEQMFTDGIKRMQFDQALQRWGDEGLTAVESWLRSGTNEINALCGDFVCFQADVSPGDFRLDSGSDFGRGYKPSMLVTVRALFSRGYLPLTIRITAGRETAPGLTNVSTPVIEGPVEMSQGPTVRVSHPELCVPDDFQPQDALKFLTVEAETKLVGEYKLGASANRAVEPKDQTCTVQLRADHTLVISNYPASGDQQRSINISGNWSLSAYRNLDLVQFRMSVSGGNDVALRGATCDLAYPNNFTAYSSYTPGLNLICRDKSGNQQKLWFRAVKGILPSGMRSNPHFVARKPTGNPPNWDTAVYNNPETRLREVIDYQRKLNNTNNWTVGLFQVRLAEMIRKSGRLDEAETNLLQGLAILVAAFPGQNGDVADAAMIHARILMDKHDLAGAEKAAREAVDKFPPQHYRLREAYQLLNQVLTAEGKPVLPLPTIAIATNAVAPPETSILDPNSVANLQFEVDKRRQLFGNESTNVADTLGLLSSVLRDEGKLAEAEAARRENMTIRRKALGDDHQQVATSYEALGSILQREGKLVEAEASIRESLVIRRKVFGNESSQAHDTLIHLNEVLKLEGKPSELNEPIKP